MKLREYRINIIKKKKLKGIVFDKKVKCVNENYLTYIELKIDPKF